VYMSVAMLMYRWLVVSLLVSPLCLLARAANSSLANWYDGIQSIKVFAPGDDVQGFASSLYQTMQRAQFSDRRYALLLKAGSYASTEIPVGYYTSLIGVAQHIDDVSINSFYTMDNPDVGNACDNFWRSAEGLAATNPSIMWATSQAAPLRRVHAHGDLWLSEKGSPHWSSGGFMSDSTIDGPLQMGTQQQFLVRNAQLNGGAIGKNKNYVFVGTNGAPAASPDGTISAVPTSPRIAPKPYIVENYGAWSIEVPAMASNVAGSSYSVSSSIDFSRVYVAKEGETAASINAGIAQMDALLLTPGIYGMEIALYIKKPGFVVLGIGFPTLVALNGLSAIYVAADDVRVAGVLLEAGTPVGSPPTQPMLWWVGNGGVMSDIFSRVGAFSYARDFKPSCIQTRADIHLEIDGSGVTVDNIWLWHADHDDCGGLSDSSYSQFGLIVRGSDVVVYGLKAEHMFDNLVQWYGDRGSVYFFQSELPYHVQGYPGTGAYMVAQNINEHIGVGLGVYMVGGYTVDTGFRVPRGARMWNAMVWSITGTNAQFRSVICNSASGFDSCYHGDRCDHNSCYQYHVGASLANTTVIVV